MPSVSLTNAFDISELDVDVQLSLSGFGDGTVNGSYVKTGENRWLFSANSREIVYVNKSDNSPETFGYWAIRNSGTSAELYTEAVTSAADHPLHVSSWVGTTPGTISAVANQDIGGTLDIRDFTNLTSLNFSQVGVTALRGNIYDKNITKVSLSGNGLTSRFLGFPGNSSCTEFWVSNNNFSGFINFLPRTMEFVNISENDFVGNLPVFENNSTIQKFIADRAQEGSPLSYPIPFDCLTGNIPTFGGCNNLTHFSIEGNSLTSVDSYFRVPSSIYYFNVSNNSLNVTGIRRILKAFNETFFEASPQLDVTGEGRTLDISGNQDFIDNSPADSNSLTYISNLQSLGWTVTT